MLQACTFVVTVVKLSFSFLFLYQGVNDSALFFLFGRGRGGLSYFFFCLPQVFL